LSTTWSQHGTKPAGFALGICIVPLNPAMLRFPEQYRYILYLYRVKELRDGEEAGKVIAELAFHRLMSYMQPAPADVVNLRQQKCMVRRDVHVNKNFTARKVGAEREGVNFEAD
jgi:hypothetical protein